MKITRAGVEGPVAVRNLEIAFSVNGEISNGIGGFQASLGENGAHGFNLQAHAHLADGHAGFFLVVPPFAIVCLILGKNFRKQNLLLLVAYGADIGQVVCGNLHALGKTFHAGRAYI